MKPSFVTFIAALTMTLAGCATALVDPISTEVYTPKADWHEVQVVSEPPAQPYKTLARVTAYADYYDEEPVLDRELRRQAAKLGADAVIRDTKPERYSGAFSAGTRNSGLAIKYKTNAVDQHQSRS